MRSLRTAQDSTGTQSAFATIEDLVSHLRTSNARYRAALPAEFLAKNPHPRSGGGRTKAAQQGGSSGGQRRQQQRQSGTLSPQQLREWFSHRGASRGSGSCPYVIRTGDRAGQTCRKPHTQYRCFSRLDDACRTEFGDEAELPRWAELLSTTITPFFAPVLVRQADSSGGPVLATSSTFLPSCPAVPSDSVSGLHLPSFSTNLTLLWHHRLGHPSLPRLRGMHSCLLVSGLPWSLPPLPPSPAPPCLPCVEGRQRAAPHSSSFPPTIAPLQTLHMDVWGPACVSGHGRERYFLLVVDDYTRYTTVFPLHNKGNIGLVMELNHWPRVSFPETLPTLRWTGKVGDASVFRVWGSRAIVCDTSAEKFSGRAIPCVFLGFPPDIVGWQFYHPTSRRVFPSQDVTFDESVPFYHPLRGTVPVEVAVDSGAARGAASAGAEPGGAESEGAGSRGAETGGAEPGGDEPAGLESGGAELAAVGAGDFATGDHGAGVTAGAGGTGGATGAGPGGARTRVLELLGLVVLGELEQETLRSQELLGVEALELEAQALVAMELEELELVALELEALAREELELEGLEQLNLEQEPASPLPATSPYTEQTGGLIERCEPASGLASPVCTGRHVPRPRPPPVPGTHAMAHRPSSVPLRVPLPPPPESSILAVSDRESDRAWAASPTFSRLLATVVTDPSFESTALCDLVYVDNLVFATADTEALTLVKSELRNYLGLQITWDREQRTITLTQSYMVRQVLQRFGFHFSSPQPTPLSSGHSLSAPPSDESIEPSGPYPELVGWLKYLMTCIRPDLAYPLSLLARYVAPVVLTGHADDSWVDDSATQQSSQGYTFSLGSGSVSWWSSHSSLVLSSSCEAEIYAGAMASQELRWLTYLLTDLGEQPRSPLQRCQLRLAYVATRANTADIFTKALPPGDHQCFSTVLGLFCPLYTALCVATALRAAAVCAPAPHTADVRTAAPLPRTTHATSLPREPLPYVPPPFAAAADALTSAATVAATTASTAATATATAAIAAARAAAATATTAEAAATAATADAFAATASAAAATAAAATATTATTAAATTTFIAATATTTATAETATAAADAAAAAAPTTAATATAATATTATATAAAAATATAAPALDAVAAPTTATH
ncbi:unnamed protein product [Closterium sp. NIES-53]